MKVRAKQVRAAREALAEACYQRNPRRGRAAAVAEANALLDKHLGVKGRRVVREVEARASAKAMRKAVDEAAIRTAIVEALTAAAAPQAAPGAGAAPQAGNDDGLFDAMAAQSRRGSPFWQASAESTASAPRSAAEPSKPLHQMDADELRAHAQAAFSAHTTARGFASPAWQ